MAALTPTDLTALFAVHLAGSYNTDEDGVAYTRVPSTGAWISADEVQVLVDEADDRNAKALAAGIDRLQATSYEEGTIFAYIEEQSRGMAFLVDEDDVVSLGARLLAGEPDAYSLWCAETTATTVTAEQIVQGLRSTHTADFNLADLRHSAASVGDIEIVAACDLLSREIQDILANSPSLELVQLAKTSLRDRFRSEPWYRGCGISPTDDGYILRLNVTTESAKTETPQKWLGVPVETVVMGFDDWQPR